MTDPYEDMPSDSPDDDRYEEHPPMKADPIPPNIASELAEMPEGETGTQAYWRQTLRHAPMPTTEKRAGEGATSDTAPLPPPYAPAVDPMAHNVDMPAPMPGTTGWTKDIHMHEQKGSPVVPGTLDQPTKPKFHFRSPESAPPDPNEILYTQEDDSDHSSGSHLGGHLGAINA